MRLIGPMRQIVSNQTLEALRRTISKTIAEATPHIQAAKENQIKILSKKFSEFNDWYMKVTGLDKVNLAQEKVTALQDQLLTIQDKRREVGRQLSDVRQRSIDLQDEIHKVKRQEDLERFLELMKSETEILKLERSISKTFQEYDQTERELFTAFTDSIRDSHEKQRAQMEYTKYFGIVLSIAGSFLAFIYSTIRKEQLKQIIDDRLKSLDHNDGQILISQVIDSNKLIVEEIIKNRKNLNDFSVAVVNKFGELENRKGGNFNTPVALNNDHFLESNAFFGGNTNYVQIAGVVLGIWLICRALGG